MAVVQYTVSVKRPWTLSVGLEDRSVCMYIWGLYLLLSVPTDRRQVFISYKMKCEGEKGGATVMSYGIPDIILS